MRKVPQPAAGSDSLHDTARIDRRNIILAQVEAALLADKLEIEPAVPPRTGTDPYNSGACKGIAATGAWTVKRPR